MKTHRSFWLTVMAAFVVLAASDTFIHRMLLGETYRALGHLWRPAEEMKGLVWVPFLAEFAIAFLLAWIYPLGVGRKSPVEEGIRFGTLMGLLLYLPSTLIKYYIYPYPVNLLGIWFVGGVAETILAGAAIGIVYDKYQK